MGRWVTTAQGRRLYIPDEGEENPYTKQIDKEIADKERQIAANKAQADQKKQEDWLLSKEKAERGMQILEQKALAKEAKRDAEHKAATMISIDMGYSDIYSQMKSLGLADVFKKKLELRGNIGKSYAVIARKIIAEAIQKGKL